MQAPNPPNYEKNWEKITIIYAVVFVFIKLHLIQSFRNVHLTLSYEHAKNCVGFQL